jgi:hypothetical protein
VPFDSLYQLFESCTRSWWHWHDSIIKFSQPSP